MNISTSVAGNGIPQPFAVKERRKEVQNQAALAKVHDAAVMRFKSSLPGMGERNDAEKAIAHLEKISLAFNKKLQFVVNHESNEITVKVIDPDTDKVVKILPPEELQRLNHNIEEAIGFLFDEKV